MRSPYRIYSSLALLQFSVAVPCMWPLFYHHDVPFSAPLSLSDEILLNLYASLDHALPLVVPQILSCHEYTMKILLPLIICSAGP